jgi:hypothetical protein
MNRFFYSMLLLLLAHFGAPRITRDFGVIGEPSV